MAAFDKGDTVSWRSQSAGSVTKKEGEVIAVVEKFQPLPRIEEDCIRRYDMPRSQNERYLVRVPRVGKRGQDLKPAYYAPMTSVVDKQMAKKK